MAQCFCFFLAGFSVSSLTLCFIAHEIAVNQDVQDKLLEEINETKAKLEDGKLTYEALYKMKYMDMVVLEAMRKWSQGSFSDRLVSKPYLIENTRGKPIQLNIGDFLLIPTHGLHMDPKYFPEPDKFDPERFNDENKRTIPAGAYMPFGIGPRSCIASRFAMMESKACLYYLVENFRFEMSAKTQNPIQLKCGSTHVQGEHGFWLKLRLRE